MGTENAQCDVFGVCGGCSLLNVPYLGQLEEKDARIAELFDGLASRDVIRPILGMEYPFHYRNKVIAPFVAARGKRGRDAGAGARGGGSRSGDARGKGGGSRDRRNSRAASPQILTGMYERGTHRVIEAPGGCLLENEIAVDVVAAVKGIMRRHGIEPYDEDAGTGFMRHAVVRVGHSSGEVLVVLVTNSGEFPSARSFCRELVRRVPAVTTVVQSVNTRRTNVVLGDRERTLFGPGFILDRLCGLSFRISAHSFYQVNSRQTEVLYDAAIGMAGLTGRETVIDAYCGTGTIGLVAASRGTKRVVGVDSVEAAVRDARQNARHNGIERAEFFVGDAGEWMREVAAADQKDGPLVLFMDPPRAGSTPEFLDAACRLRPERVVYISCNPETQARDVRRLIEGGYRVEGVQPVDMFPHTPHIECVCGLVAEG